MTIAPNTDIVTMLAVSDWPPNLIHSSLKIAAMPTTPPARIATCGVPQLRMDAAEQRRQVAGAREREDLPRVADDDAVEGGDQAEQAEPHQHVQPAAVRADDDLHRLRAGAR